MAILNLIGTLSKGHPLLRNLDLDPQGKNLTEDWSLLLSDRKDSFSDGMIPRSYSHYPGHESSKLFQERILSTVNHFNFSDRVYPEIIQEVDRFLESLK